LDTISARLFGSFEVAIDGVDLPKLRSRKSYLLLALLMLHANREVERDFACQALWPESTLEKARLGLRQCLNDVRSALGPSAWRLGSPTTRSLLLNCEGCEIDVVEFDKVCLKQDLTTERVDRLLSLFRRPLLEQYDADFVYFERDHRTNKLLGVIEHESKRAIDSGESSTAARWARYALTLIPHSESACRCAMKALAVENDIPEALQIYSEFRLRLWREMRREPNAETIAVYHSLKTGVQPNGAGQLQHKRTIRSVRHLMSAALRWLPACS